MKRAAAGCTLALLLPVLAAGAAPLAPQDASISAVTASGVSSGATMAVQFHVALSARVKGVGALAAVPWYCAEGTVRKAWFNCMRPRSFTPLPPLERLHAEARALDASGRIDSLSNLAAARVWLFSGSRDDTVAPQVVAALATWYSHYLRLGEARLVRDVPAGHGMVTADPDVSQACDASRSPWLNRCVGSDGRPIDAAGALLEYLLGPPAGAPAETGALLPFDQGEFADGPPHAISMADTGYVYVPAACRGTRCRVHVAFHGCGQHAGRIGTAYVRDAGYNRWAEAHRLIILYPQTVARYGWSFGSNFVFNPAACWDWWGYTGRDYHTRSGPQIRAVRAMVERLGQRADRVRER